MKKKIAVVGGGLGSMSFIYNLMSQPRAKELYQITLYQESWCLGGKGASGVNREKGYRVEEHGIHFWFGFYENAFSLMKNVYGALNRKSGSPLATFDEAFKSQKTMDFAQEIDGKWTKWHVDFPPLPGTVGDGEFLFPIENAVEIGIKMMAEEIGKISNQLNKGCLGKLMNPFGTLKHPVHGTHEPYLNKIEASLASSISHIIERKLMAMAAFYKDHAHHSDELREENSKHIQSIKKWIWDHLGDMVSANPSLLRVWCVIDFGFAVLKGMIKDGVLKVKDRQFELDFSSINQHDFQSWLILHGADKTYIEGFPAVKSMYDGPFAFFRGAITTPNVEAGTALNIFLRLAFTSKEHVMWRMQAGMGDTVFTPIYEYLQREFPDNVQINFFHKVKNLKLDVNHQFVEEITIERLIDLAPNVESYQPFINVKGLNCWPSEPLYEQLDPAQVARIKADKILINSDWSGWKGTEITKKIGDDFDIVVVGASLSALPHFCSDLIRHNDKWANMLDKVGTVQTQAFQLWFTKSAEEMNLDPLQVLSTYVEPLDTFASMHQILAREDWSKYPSQPKYLMYVCGALLDSEAIPPPHATYFPEDQKNEVFQNVLNYINNDLRFIIPAAFDDKGNFDWNYLYDAENRVGQERLKYQYYRANIDSTERYVFSLAGSSKHRIKTNETGYKNVLLTGDWIQNGMNIGFVEGATISGILAAKAVSEDDNDIPLFLPW